MPAYLVRLGPLAVLLAAVLIGSGCKAPSPELDTTEAGRVDSVSTLLSGVDDTAFRAAFSGIDDYRYTRYTRTEQFDTDDYLVAYRESVHRAGWDAGLRTISVQQEDSAGTFDFGLFDRFTSSTLTGLDPIDLVKYLLPEEPPYLQGRNREKYEWSFLPDTLLWDTQAKVIEVKARRLKGDGENIRKVRHYVDRTTNELIAMYLERIDLALLFREESQFYVHMRRADDGTLVPHNTRFQTHIRTPFETDNKFRTVSTYYELEPIPDLPSTTEDAVQENAALSSETTAEAPVGT
ncbi:MAG: hypothetical protein HKN29_14630 [Rhodothermales bacterium]|nr:hypothetical protein [Rhodothermales bacterium]